MAGNGPQRAIRSRRVVVGGAYEPLRVEPATLLLHGARIAAVLAHDAALPPEVPIDDRGGDIVSPSFIDAHVHTPMLYFRGLGGALAMRGNVVEDLFYAVETKLQPGDVRAFARLGAYELLRAGTGTIWEHYYFAEELAEGLRDAGITGFVAPTLQDRSGPGVPWLDAQLEATVRLDDDRSLADAGLFAALGPHATDTVSADLWARIATLAAERDLPIHAHVAQSYEEVERAWSRDGCTPVGLLARSGALDASHRFLMVHGIFLSDDDQRMLDPARHTLGFCPFSQLQFSVPADVLRWTGAGLPWVVATDCAACNDGMDVQKELRFVSGARALRAAHSAEREAFATQGTLQTAATLERTRQAAYDLDHGWSDPAALLRRVWSVPGSLDPRWPTGAIEAGRVANLCVWEAEHPAFWPTIDPLRALAMGSPLPALRDHLVAGSSIGGHDGVRGLTDLPEVREAAAEARRRLELLLERLA